jgi:hypothetical protein
MQYASPPSDEGSSVPELAFTKFSSDRFVWSDMPKYGVGTGNGLHVLQSAPSQGNLRLTSALLRDKFQPVAMLQNLSTRKTFQKTRRLSSSSAQSLEAGKNAIRAMIDLEATFGTSLSSLSMLSWSCSTVRAMLPTMDHADGPRPLPIWNMLSRNCSIRAGRL